MTALLLLLFAPEENGVAQVGVGDTAGQVREVPDTVSVIEPVATDDLLREQEAEETPRDAAEEVAGTLQGLWDGFVANLPRYGIALGILLLVGILVRLLRLILPRVLGRWERVGAITAISGVVLWLVGFGIAVSVLVGDVRALVGSLGLVGLALSWALQGPIESFTAWLLNSFKGYYRIGDRIAVGEVFGDVYRIDFLTTTVWEYGGPDRPPGQVRAEQPTGRLITFPNNEVLSGSIINFSRDFPYVWDELELSVEHESDITYAARVVEEVAKRVVGERMAAPAREYGAILLRARLELDVPGEPQVFFSLGDAAVNLTVRFLVPVRQRRIWRSELAHELLLELKKPEHAEKIFISYQRTQLQLLDQAGMVRPWPDRAEGSGRDTVSG